MFRFGALLVVTTACVASSVSLAAQREAVKNKAGDASRTKTAPPSKTPGGSEFTAPGKAGPEKGGGDTAGAGTMAATDTEAKTDTKGENRPGGRGSEKEKEKEKIAYDYGLPSPEGKNLSLADFKGKVLLIVNLGRKSSYAAQLPALESLANTWKDQGLVVLGVPSNDFGDAEPGTDAEIAKAYADAKVNFVVAAKSTLTGVHQLPLFEYLAKNKAIPEDGLHWNFTKFVVDRKGKVILRFGPDVAPDSLEMQATLQEVLDGTWKPKKEKSRGEGEGGGDEGGPPSM